MSEFEKELMNKVSPHDRTFKGHELFLGGFLLEHFKDWQPPKPLAVVPQIVAYFIEVRKESLKLCGAFREIEECYGAELYDWVFQKSNGQDLFARAWLDGYTVEKPQLFYLNNKIKLEDVGSDLIGYLNLFLTNNGYLTSNINRAKKFTQQEIDSMETGSYEQKEVEP